MVQVESRERLFLRYSVFILLCRPQAESPSRMVSLGTSLPAAAIGPYRSKRRGTQNREVMPTALPPCFAEVWRRRSSSLEVHRNERAALEAVAATIPEAARGETDPATAAGLYLAALVVALRRVVQTSKPAGAPRAEKGQVEGEGPMSKRQRQKARKRATERDAVAAADAMHAEAATGGGDEKKMEADAAAKDDAPGGGEAALVASLVYLVSLALHDASPALVNARCENILECVAAAVAHAGGAAVVGRHAAAAIAGTLALVDGKAWARPAVQRAHLRLVMLAADADPKTRRRGREALQSLVDGPKGDLISARTSGASAAHVVAELRSLQGQIGESIDKAHLDGHSAPTKLIHLVTSIAVLVPALRPADATAVAKELVVVASLNLAHVTDFAYNTLASLVDMRELLASRKRPDANVDDGSDGDGDEGLAKDRRTMIPTAHLGKIVVAIAEQTVPTDTHEDALVAFATCLSRGAVTYFEAHAFSSPPVETMATVVKSLVDCLDPIIARLSVAPKLSRALQDVVSHRWLHARPDVFKALEPLFGYRFKGVWIDALAALRRFLEHNACAGNVAMRECVAVFSKHVVAMREQAYKAKDRHTQSVTNSTLAAILRGGGVQSVFEAVPLARVDKLLLSNAWLLPLLHEHLRCSPMSLFASKIRPLADDLSAFGAEASDGGRLVEGKNASMLAAQLWGLLPGFCQNPSDLEQDAAITVAFDSMAVCLSDTADLAMRQSAFSALRALGQSVSADDEATQKRFAKGLKKIFPSICDVIQGTSADRRGSALEAVTKAAQACHDPKLVTSLLRKSVRRLLEASMTDADEDSSLVRHASTDVAIALAESGAVPTDSAEIDFLERAMSPLFLDPSDTGLQKKAYRATALLVGLGVIGKDQQAGKSFIEETAAAAGSVATSAKGTRLGLIQALVELSKSDPVLLEVCTSSFLSEVVLGTRDVSEKTRASSFAALSSLGRTWYASGERADGLSAFLTRLAAGLAGRTVLMLAATLTSLSHVVYEYRGEAAIYSAFAQNVDSLFAVISSGDTSMPQGNTRSDDDEEGDDDDDENRMAVEEVIAPGPVAILLRHSSREVQKAALGTVKMATSALSQPSSARLVRVLPAILPGLVTVAAKSKKKETRLRVRVILERLLRKCGRDTLESVFPQEHIKLLAAVRKQYSRDMTKKHEKRDARRAEKASVEKAEDAARAQKDVDDDNDSSGSDDGSDFVLSDDDSDIEREILDGDELASRKTTARRKAASSGPLLVRENGDNVVDLLATRVADGFMTRGEVAEASKRAHVEQSRKRKDKDSFKLADDGRPIFAESDAESGEAEHGSDRGGDGLDGEDGGGARGGKKRKRRAPDAGERAKKVKGSFGGEYRSRRGAAGDMKRPGLADPYAYVPLSGAMGGDVSKALMKQGGGGKGSKKGRASKLGGRRGVPARR